MDNFRNFKTVSEDAAERLARDCGIRLAGNNFWKDRKWIGNCLTGIISVLDDRTTEKIIRHMRNAEYLKEMRTSP